MSNNRRQPASWMSAWWPVLLAITIIVLESTQMMGSSNTSGPLRHLVEFFFGKIADSHWETVHFYIRKSGHFFGYGLMGLAWLRGWAISRPRLTMLSCALAAVASTAFIASCDELHQSTLPNRTGTPHDVLIDTAGALVLILVVLAGKKLFRPLFFRRIARRA
jgi:VanZ family protein